MKKKIVVILAILLMIPVFQTNKVQSYAWINNYYLYSFDPTHGHRAYARYGTYERYTPWKCQGVTGSVIFDPGPMHYHDLIAYKYSVCP